MYHRSGKHLQLLKMWLCISSDRMNLKALSYTLQTLMVLISQSQHALLICFTQGWHALIKSTHGGEWSPDKRIVWCSWLTFRQIERKSTWFRGWIPLQLSKHRLTKTVPFHDLTTQKVIFLQDGGTGGERFLSTISRFAADKLGAQRNKTADLFSIANVFIE